jgi:hypothetical protein
MEKQIEDSSWRYLIVGEPGKKDKLINSKPSKGRSSKFPGLFLLFPAVRERTREQIRGFLSPPPRIKDSENYIISSQIM